MTSESDAIKVRDEIDLIDYFHLVRRVSLALVYVAPLLIAYEVALHVVDPSVQNAVEGSLKRLLWYAGPTAIYFHLFLIATVSLAMGRVFYLRLPVFRLYPAFLIESALFAVVLGPIVSWLDRLLPMSVATEPAASLALSEAILSSISAGLYEEYLFRLVILGGLFFFLFRIARARYSAAIGISITVSSFLFAGYHYVGPYGDPWLWSTFGFRVLAGVLLGALFALRGFGVVVYLHAFYDVIIDLKTAGWPGFES